MVLTFMFKYQYVANLDMCVVCLFYLVGGLALVIVFLCGFLFVYFVVVVYI